MQQKSSKHKKFMCLKIQKIEKNNKEKRGIIIIVVTGLIALAYEGISSYLHNKRWKVYKKDLVLRKEKVNLERHKIFHLESSMAMYVIYKKQ